MYDEKKDDRERWVPQVTLEILETASEVKETLKETYRRGGGYVWSSQNAEQKDWILEVSWVDCGLSEFAVDICNVNLETVPIALDKKQIEKLWSYLAFYWDAFLHNGKKFYNKQHKAPDFAIVSAMFRETEWGALGLMDKKGIQTREFLSHAVNLLYYTRYADVVHAHFIVELQMIFATLRKPEDGPDDEARVVEKSELYKIENNWLTFCNFLSLVSDIDRVQPDLNSQLNVLGDLRLTVESLMKYVSFGLQYVYANVKKMPKGEELCAYKNYHDPLYGHERDFVKTSISSHKLPAKPYLLTQSENSFRIVRSKNCTPKDIAEGIQQFATMFVNPWFQTLLTYFNHNCITDMENRQYHPAQVKSVERMLQKAEDLKMNNLELALLSLHDICRASFRLQLPQQFLEVVHQLKSSSDHPVMQQLEVIRIMNLYNEDEEFLKTRGKNKEIKLWSQEGILHYRNLKISVKIKLPETVTYVDHNGNRFIGKEFIGEIELLMDSYLYVKKETHKYWKIQRIRKSKDLLNLPLWEHPDEEVVRKSRRSEELYRLEKQAALLRDPKGGREACWKEICLPVE